MMEMIKFNNIFISAPDGLVIFYELGVTVPLTEENYFQYIFLSEQHICEITISLPTNTGMCTKILFRLLIHQQSKLPFFAGLLHSVIMNINLSSGEFISFTEAMVVQQRVIIVQPVKSDGQNCALNVVINPLKPLAVSKKYNSIGKALELARYLVFIKIYFKLILKLSVIHVHYI